MFYSVPITTKDILSDAKKAANVMHPDYIWPGLCNQIKRNPTPEEWFEVCKDSPFLKNTNGGDLNE